MNAARKCAISLRRGSVVGAALVAFTSCLLGGAVAQQKSSPRIWDIPFGTPVGKLPASDFVDPACGSNGGPPGLALTSFADFARCGRDAATGLHEIWFAYDDEMEYVARATRDATLIGRYQAMQVLGHPVVLSLLIDPEGIVQGYRVASDSRAEPLVRLEGASLAVQFKVRFGYEGWACIDPPPADGETPIGKEFIKQRCTLTRDGRMHVVESRYLLKPGQTVLDPHTRKPLVGEGAFESWAKLEVYRSQATLR